MWYFEYSLQKKLYGPFLWTGLNCLKSAEPVHEGSLLFITHFREIPGTHLISLIRMKDWLDLGATRWLSTQNHWIGNPVPYLLDQFLFFHCWYSMKARYAILGTLALLTITKIINYFVYVGSGGIFQDSALKIVFSVLFFLKWIKKKHFRSTWTEQFYLVLFTSFIVFL